MAPTRDPAITSRMMAAVKAKNTKPETTLRRALFARGLRYRIHDKRLPGRPDLVFSSARVVVFVDGDFWHGQGWKERGLSGFEEQFPSNREFWVRKIKRNVERDIEVNEMLKHQAWMVIRVLESAVKADLERVAAAIEAEVKRRASGQAT